MFGVNPWLLLAGLVAATGVYLKGREDGKAVIIASQAKALAAQQAMVAAELRSIGTNLAQLKPINRTIIQKVEREVIEKPVFRDCHSGPDVVQQYNAIVDGTSNADGTGELPKTDAPR